MPRGSKMCRLDANHKAVVDHLKAYGASVQSLAAVGSGCADLLVGYRGVNILMEVKDGAKRKSDQELTEPERKWHENWRGSVVIVKSAEEALDLIKDIQKPIFSK